VADLEGEVIYSADNSAIKRIRSLRRRKTRESERAFVVEGVRAVEDAIRAGGVSTLVLTRSDSAWRPDFGLRSLRIKRVEPRLFNSLSETESSQPVLAVFEMPQIAVQERGLPLFLVVDGIRDPGNLGTLLRSAAAVDASAVLVAPETVDSFNGKVVRAGMGAHFRVPIIRLDESWTERLRRTCSVRVLAEARSEATYDQVDWHEPSALIVGSEAHGPSSTGRELANASARIPLLNDIESLNAGVAGSIMLFEAMRQRGAKSYTS
jgi:TrmH family RNA methyltransferase